MTHALFLTTSLFYTVSQPAVAHFPEIVVTGERIARDKNETASSVDVISARDIETMAAPDRIEQILALVPNVQLGSGGDGPTIRGQDSGGVVRDLPAFLSGVRPRATVVVDGRAISYYELAFGLTSLWDVEQIEVFRSPQTSSQGRNSIGGAIFVNTSSPSFIWEARIRGLAGNFNTRQLSALVSGPLSEDQLAIRLSADIRGGRTSSKITNPAVGVDANRDEGEQFRTTLMLTPRGLADMKLSFTYVHSRSQMPQIEGIEAPYKSRKNPNASYGIFAIVTDSLTGQFAYESARGFETRTVVSVGNSRVRRYAPAGLGEAQIGARDFSVEQVVRWPVPKNVRFAAGLHFTRATLDQTIDLNALQQGRGRFDDTQSSLGIFGEASLPLSDDVELAGSLRYQRDRQVRKGGLTGGRVAIPLQYDGRFKSWSPKITLGWDVTPQLRFGILAQRASNPGGVNLNSARARTEIFKAEKLWAFEVFVRSQVLSNRLVLSANAFRYNMIDAQRTQTVTFAAPNGLTTTTAQVDNAPRAYIEGFEVDAVWKVTARLKLRATAGLLKSRITQTVAASDPMLGKSFQRSPAFTGAAMLEWLPSKGITLSGQARHHSQYFSDDLETRSRRVNPATIFDARAAWTRGNFTFSAYARNLTNSFSFTYKFANGLATAEDPRELGIGIDVRF